jgi:hypothetical protein
LINTILENDFSAIIKLKFPQIDFYSAFVQGI